MTRACDGCTACCKSLSIRELDKPPGSWCPHCKIGKGCAVYHVRPEECRSFRCVWLVDEVGIFKEEHRPDRGKVVFDIQSVPNHPGVAVLCLHEMNPGSADRKWVGELTADILRRNRYLVLETNQPEVAIVQVMIFGPGTKWTKDPVQHYTAEPRENYQTHLGGMIEAGQLVMKGAENE